MTVPTMPNAVKQFITLVQKGVNLYDAVFFAWMVAENVCELEDLKDDFNPFNILYPYEDHKPWTSNQPYWVEATGIKQNGVVVYPDIETGARATVAFLMQNYYTDIRGSVGKSPLEQAKAIQNSPWDAANYFKDTEAPGHIVSLLVQWGFVDKPIDENKEVIANSKQESIAKAAQDVAAAFGDMWEHIDPNGQAFLHYHMQVLRVWLVMNAIGDWDDNAQTHVLYHEVNADYTI